MRMRVCVCAPNKNLPYDCFIKTSRISTTNDDAKIKIETRNHDALSIRDVNCIEK